jgi:hypothetical protein
MIGQDHTPYPYASPPKSPFVDFVARISHVIDTWLCGLFRKKNTEPRYVRTTDGSYAALCDV